MGYSLPYERWCIKHHGSIATWIDLNWCYCIRSINIFDERCIEDKTPILNIEVVSAILGTVPHLIVIEAITLHMREMEDDLTFKMKFFSILYLGVSS